MVDGSSSSKVHSGWLWLVESFLVVVSTRQSDFDSFKASLVRSLTR